MTRVKSLFLDSSSSFRFRASRHRILFGTLADPWAQICLFKSASIRTSAVPISTRANFLMALMALAARNFRPEPFCRWSLLWRLMVYSRAFKLQNTLETCRVLLENRNSIHAVVNQRRLGYLFSKLISFRHHFVNVSDHVEGHLRKVIILTTEQAFES